MCCQSYKADILYSFCEGIDMGHLDGNKMSNFIHERGQHETKEKEAKKKGLSYLGIL